jgi:hypothetical protein
LLQRLLHPLQIARRLVGGMGAFARVTGVGQWVASFMARFAVA